MVIYLFIANPTNLTSGSRENWIRNTGYKEIANGKTDTLQKNYVPNKPFVAGNDKLPIFADNLS